MTHIAHALIILGQLAIVALAVWLWVKYVWTRIDNYWQAVIPTLLLVIVVIYFCPTPEALSIARI